MILEFADAWNFVVANTWFKKNKGRLISYEIPGKCRTVIDYILIRKRDRKLIRDVKVIRQEECISRAALVVKKPTGVEEVWKNFKECLTEEAVEVYGETWGMRRHKESWW